MWLPDWRDHGFSVVAAMGGALETASRILLDSERTFGVVLSGGECGVVMIGLVIFFPNWMALRLKRGLHAIRYLKKVVIECCGGERKEWRSMSAHIYIVLIQESVWVNTVCVKRTIYRCSPNKRLSLERSLWFVPANYGLLLGSSRVGTCLLEAVRAFLFTSRQPQRRVL